MLDNRSLAFLKDVLDPSVNTHLDVTVHTIHIRDPDFPTGGNPLTRRFLQHIGHGIERLLITFQEPYALGLIGKLSFAQAYAIRSSKLQPLDELIKYVEPTQVSRCTKVRMLCIGFPKLSYARSIRQDPIPPLVSAMWKMLSALPSPNDLEEF